MSEKNAPYLVYTDDENFVLNKEDINSGGGSGGNSGGNSGVVFLPAELGEGVFIVTFTYNDIVNYISNNVVPFLHIDTQSVGMLIAINAYSYSNNTYNVAFGNDYYTFEASDANTIMVQSDGPK